MKVPLQEARYELMVQRSRFLGLSFPIASQEDARIRLKSLKDEFSDASHVVHAFSVGLQNSVSRGCSDDGEPNGTAGRPVLEVLKGFDCSNVFLAIVRWFGGTKLGTGGLVRAYSETAKGLLQATPWQEFVATDRLSIRIHYAEHKLLLQLTEKWNARILAESFNETVEVSLSIPAEFAGSFKSEILDITHGRDPFLPLSSEL